jgi:hypothetical protein
MDTATRRELESIGIELKNVINELNNIAFGVRADFTGIGNEHCATSIIKVSDQYRWVKRKLDQI